jgi:P-type E1-E2 ATPase
MRELGLQLPPQLPAWLQAANCKSAALVFVAWQAQVRGVYACDDALRPEAAAVVEQLRQMDIVPAVLSGDRPARVAHVARQLGLQAQGGLLPDQKVARLRQAKQRYGKIAMVGDGINDAPALATADVGIALACGADVSRDAADVCLLSSHLQQVPQAILLARKTVRTIRQNLFWAFAYNVIGVALAATGHLNPMWAAAAMTISSVLVVSNSLRLGAQKQPASPIENPV